MTMSRRSPRCRWCAMSSTPLRDSIQQERAKSEKWNFFAGMMLQGIDRTDHFLMATAAGMLHAHTHCRGLDVRLPIPIYPLHGSILWR